MDNIANDFQRLEERLIRLKDHVQAIVDKKDSTITDLKKYIKVGVILCF
jgi:hypothetical protein